MDMETVISKFEKWCDEIADECPVICLDALSLLKEQDKIIQNILREKTNELNNKVATLQIELQNQEMRRSLEQK